MVTHLAVRHILVVIGQASWLTLTVTRHQRNVQDLHLASILIFDHSLRQQVVAQAQDTALHTRQTLHSSSARTQTWVEVARVMAEEVGLLKDLGLVPRGVAVLSLGQIAYLRWRPLMNIEGTRLAQTLATQHPSTLHRQDSGSACSDRMTHIQASHNLQHLVAMATNRVQAPGRICLRNSPQVQVTTDTTLASRSQIRIRIPSLKYNLQTSSLAGLTLLRLYRVPDLQSRTPCLPARKGLQAKDRRRLIRWEYQQRKERAIVLLCDTQICSGGLHGAEIC